MQIHLLFNAILLTLSLATLLLTLVSYSVYKFRLLPTREQNTAGSVKADGVFFRRYFPSELKAEYFPEQPNGGTKKESIFAPLGRNLGLFFIIISSVIFISFMVETFVTHDRHFFDGKEFAAKVKTLQEKGLYQHYSFNRSFENLTLEESVPLPTTAQIEYLLPELRKKSIQILNTTLNEKLNPVASRRAVTAWVDFLKSEQIPYALTESVPRVNSNAILVLPQAAVLNDSEREQINAMIAQGESVVATGPVGVFDGQGKPANSQWSATAFSVQFAEANNSAAGSAGESTTWISGNAAPYWEIPPGTQIQWPVIDARYRASYDKTNTKNNVAMWEIRNEVAGESARSPRAVLHSENGNRVAWSLVDPLAHSAENKSAIQTYQDLAFFSMLAWVGHVPIARVANWPNGKDMAVVPAVEVRNFNGNTRDLARKLNDLKIPTTYLLNVDESKSFASFRKSLSNTNEVVLSLSEDTDLANQDLKKQFDAIEAARLETEYQTEQPVWGFHVLSGSYDLQTLKALMQNRISYLSVNSQSLKLAPSFISNGDLVMVPGSFVTNTEARDDFKNHLNSVLEIAAELHGMYVFQTDRSDDNTIPDTLKSLTEKSNVSFFTMNDAVKWWKNKNQLKLTIGKRTKNGPVPVAVSNLGDDAAPAVAVWIDDGKEAKLTPVGNLGGLSESNIEIKE